MHEMSLAAELIEQIQVQAKQHGLIKVSRVEIEAGQMRGVVPEAMEAAFRAVSEGTVAEGAELVQIEVRAKARCRSCGKFFRPKMDDYRCPGCEHAEMSLVEGNDLILKSLSGEADEK